MKTKSFLIDQLAYWFAIALIIIPSAVILCLSAAMMM